jgi:hypothetical protein
VGTIGTWIVGLALGFSLIHLPFLAAFSYAPLLRSSGKGLLEAVYISAVALTTLGSGDIIAGTDARRLVEAVEAAAGAATITAAISYVLSVYPWLPTLEPPTLWIGDLEPSDRFALARGGRGVVSGCTGRCRLWVDVAAARWR